MTTNPSKPEVAEWYRIRLLALRLTCKLTPSFAASLFRRANLLHVGMSGNVSILDTSLAEKENLLLLTGFWLWVMQPYITEARAVNASAFRQACINVLGEDPEEDYETTRGGMDEASGA